MRKNSIPIGYQVSMIDSALRNAMLGFVVTVLLFATGCSKDTEFLPRISRDDSTMPDTFADRAHSALRLKSKYSHGDSEFWSVAVTPNGKIWSVQGWNEQNDKLHFSTDFGRTWQSVGLPVDSRGVNGDIYFLDETRGWFVNDRLLLRTTNGGQSWTRIELPDNSEVTKLQSIRFFNSKTGIIGGSSSRMGEGFEPVSGVEVLCTNNGGYTWKVCYSDDKHQSVFGLLVVAEASVVLLLDGKFLIASDDMKAWKSIAIKGSPNAAAIYGDEIWLVGKGGLFTSRKANREHWVKNSSLSKESARFANWNDIAFNDRGVGIAVADEGVVAYSLDRGVSWHVLENGISEDLFEVELSNSIAVVSGEKNLYTFEIN